MIKQFLVAAIIMLAIDSLWLSVIANKLYKSRLGFLLRDKPDFAAAGLFYVLYIVGVTVLVLVPATSVLNATLSGGLFGLVAYATYDLTNQATVKNWPKLITVVDLLWGGALTATVAGLTTAIVS